MRSLGTFNSMDVFKSDGDATGHRSVTRAAKDPIAQVPQDVETTKLLERNLCRAKLGEGVWEVTGMSGEVKTIAFHATYDVWKKTCEELLKEAIGDDSRS